MPELPVPPASDRRVWENADVSAIRDRATGDLGRPWPVPLARDYARYFRDGDRVGYEEVVRARERRVTRAAVLAAATLDERWLDELADGVTLLSEQSSWCWPAHDDTFARYSSVVPTVTDPYLDLGAGEVAAQLGWIDHLLGAALDERVPGLRARIRHEVDRRVLTPFESRRDWHWLGLDGDVHNWNPWIHGNLLVATLALVGEPHRRTRLLALITEGLARYEASLPADGAIDEGYLYWWHGALKLLEAYDLLGLDPPATVVAFPHRVHLGGDWYLNHADGPARVSHPLPWDALHRAARRVGDRRAAAHAATHRGSGASAENGLGPLLRSLTDPEWLAAAPEPVGPPGNVWFPSTQVLIARGRRLTLAVKGGHNGEHHNHNDTGSFVVALGGVPVLIDPGRPTYTAQTFGPGRYEIWTMRSSWHNTPTIDGVEQQAGRAFRARDVVAGDAAVTMELAGAYGVPGSWVRTARLDGDVVTVRDSWDAAAAAVHLVLAGEVVLGDGQATVTALAGAGVLTLSWPPAVPAALVVRPLDDPMLSDVWGARLTRLDLDVSGLDTLDLTVKEQQ